MVSVRTLPRSLEGTDTLLGLALQWGGCGGCEWWASLLPLTLRLSWTVGARVLVVEPLSGCLLLPPSQSSSADAGMLRHQEAAGAE